MQEFIEEYLQKTGEIAREISREEIEKAVAILFDAWKEGRRVFVAGNGGSAATAAHLAADLSKFVSAHAKRRLKAISLNDNMPLFSAITNDLGWENVYVEQLQNLMEEGDVFIAISVHGGAGAERAGPWSQNLLKAAKFAKGKNGKVIGMAGFDGGMLKEIADVCVVVPSESTPQIEGFHSVVAHLLAAQLRELLAKEASK